MYTYKPNEQYNDVKLLDDLRADGWTIEQAIFKTPPTAIWKEDIERAIENCPPWAEIANFPSIDDNGMTWLAYQE